MSLFTSQGHTLVHGGLSMWIWRKSPKPPKALSELPLWFIKGRDSDKRLHYFTLNNINKSFFSFCSWHQKGWASRLKGIREIPIYHLYYRLFIPLPTLCFIVEFWPFLPQMSEAPPSGRCHTLHIRFIPLNLPKHVGATELVCRSNGVPFCVQRKMTLTSVMRQSCRYVFKFIF